MAKGRKRARKLYVIVVRPKAADDLDAIFRYIALDSPRNAERVMARVLAAIDELALFPEAYALARESEAFGLEIRQRVVGKNRVLYTLDGSRVRILRVRSTFQDALSPEDDPMSD